MLPIEFFVEGHPVAQPRGAPMCILPKMKSLARAPRSVRPLWHWLSKNCKGGNRGVPKDHRVHAWRASIRADFRLAFRDVEPITFPIVVDLCFVMPRPKNATRKTKANPRLWASSKPDRDNLTKAVFDELNKLAWHDDALIVDGRTPNFVAGDGDRCGVAIRISKAPEIIETWADHLIQVGGYQRQLL